MVLHFVSIGRLSGVSVQITNTQSRYGLVSVFLHWSIALLTVSLFFLGIWMVELDYYDNWYQLAPWWQKGLGVVTLILLIARGFWRLYNASPSGLETISKAQQKIAHSVHFLMNFLILLICISGYLIVTAKGKALIVFDWFSVPALVTSVNNLEDLAGDVHYVMAYLLMGLVVLHMFAALFHHFISKDRTLKRMFGK